MGMTREEAEQVLLSSKNPRMKEQYALGVISPIVLANAVGIRPQMVYNYIRQGKIRTLEDSPHEGVTTNSTQHIVIDWEVAVLWVQKFVGRKVDKQERIEAQLRGEA